MSKLLFFSIIFQTLVLLISSECQLETPLISIESTIDGFSNDYIYFYIPVSPIGIYQNSICIYNEKAEILDCLNMRDFKEEMSFIWKDPSFLAIKHITDNLYLINYLQDDVFISVSLDISHWIIIDEYFNIKKEYAIMEMTPQTESSLFKSDAFVNVHDAVITEGLEYGIIIVRQYNPVTDVQEHFPDSPLKGVTITSDGLCAIDLKTGKEKAALSADGVLSDFSNWYEYINEESIRILYPESVNEETIDVYDIEIDITEVTSMNIVDGSHFSPKLENEKLYLINSRYQSTGYLIKWEFENTSEIEVIWKLPGSNPPLAIKKEWSDKWTYVNDPFYGFSSGHDLNVFGVPKGHILIQDNGNNHRASDDNVIYCPMTRSIEYKIEMDINGNEGYHQITLVFSYPKISDYPKYINIGTLMDFDAQKCKPFWDIHNYAFAIGSIRKNNNGEYIITDYDYEIYYMETLPYTTRMVKVNSDGDVLITWYAIDSYGASYRINLFDAKLFRNGIYSNSTTDSNKSEFIV